MIDYVMEILEYSHTCIEDAWKVSTIQSKYGLKVSWFYPKHYRDTHIHVNMKENLDKFYSWWCGTKSLPTLWCVLVFDLGCKK